MKRCVNIIAILVPLAAVALFAQTPRVPSRPVSVNTDALRYARDVIMQGRFTNDKHGDWREHRPSAEEKNAFVRQRGFEEYSRWHLAIDAAHREDSKARYKFPVGDFKTVHRCALIAIKDRARQHNYPDIERAASDLLNVLEFRSSD